MAIYSIELCIPGLHGALARETHLIKAKTRHEAIEQAYKKTRLFDKNPDHLLNHYVEEVDWGSPCFSS